MSVDFFNPVMYHYIDNVFKKRKNMKIARRIISLIFAAVIFMSAFVVFAENESVQVEEPTVPNLTVSVTLENEASLTIDGNMSDEELNALFKKFAKKTATPPFYALMRDYPDITMWLMETKVTPNYKSIGTGKEYALSTVTYSLLGHENYLDPEGMVDQLDEVITAFKPTGKTMYDQLLSIHDYICKMNTYANETDGALYCYTAYGALVDRKSVCEGYAEAFKLICDNNKIDCILVEGVGVSSNGTEPHMWNYVRMDDGKWYAVDVTWDDRSFGPASTNYFLVGANTEINGKIFSESHKTVKSFDNMIFEGFEYPDLEPLAYDSDGGKIEHYIYGEGKEYYYSFLNDAQKELYDAMFEQIMLNIPSDPDKTPSPAPTDDMVTTEPQETTTEETTTEETTTEETTTEETTTEETTTEETTTEETSTSDTTTEETTTEETTTEETTTEETTTEETSTSDTTTEETTTEETTTEDTSTSETTAKETSASDTVTAPNTSEDETSQITTLPETEISTEKPTTPPDTTEKNGSSGGKKVDVYRAVTVIVIVSAITCLSLILGVVVIKFAGKHKE